MSTEDAALFGWVLALVAAGGAGAWLVLLLQALFYDRRIALVGVFAGALAALSMAVSEGLSYALLAVAAVVNLVFIALYVVRHIRTPAVYLSLVVLCLSAGGGLWLALHWPQV